ncbi:NPCBM/NEW2 domain-containing protein [Verrucosispora sp. WMMD1129]|uniref:NPCBM/NEW2 domain-containing protein n=1 Tax=Verrucosispora sp. WMMD1129 TaxID=3016093 RepID=UPI00249A9C66|nr:NPCBM/NEW2 domain-containing protein [Verrucosispora sp. WMMD1129]WFE47573.1 NPCBM/NEW2 domain-containing protein [Verrucosispora sp. WMMD1129]
MSQQSRDSRAEEKSGDRRTSDARPAAENATELRTKKIIAILGACTAVLGLLTAVLGVVNVRVNQQKDQAEGQVESLSGEVSSLSEQTAKLKTERDTLVLDIDGLRKERDTLRQELDEATSGDGGSSSDGTPPKLIYLADEQMLRGSTPERGAANVGGETYVHSISIAQGYGRSEAKEVYVEYDLRSPYTKFTATLGLSDKNRNANRVVKFEVIVDQEVIREVTLAAGKSERVDVSVADGQRLRLQMTFFRPADASGYDDNDTAVWGDAALRI